MAGQNEQDVVETIEPATPAAQGGIHTTPMAPTQPVVEEEEVLEIARPIPVLQPAAPAEAPPAQQPATPLDTLIPEVAAEIVEEPPAAQKQGGVPPEVLQLDADHPLANVFLPGWGPVTPASEPAPPPPVDENFLRGVTATARDFTNDDRDFCPHCLAIGIDHAAWCQNWGRF